MVKSRILLHRSIPMEKVVWKTVSENLQKPTWYVATKLHPPLVRKDTIKRTNLEEALSNSVRTNPLTLVSAPAGYGKTTLLANLTSISEFPLAWITLEAEENDPVRFIGLFVTALQQLHPACGDSVWPLISGGDVTGSVIKHAVAILVNDIMEYLSEPFIVVLDDLHFVTEPLVYVALDYLLDQRPENLRLVIGTRHDPPLRLSRLAARRQLGEFRRSDLNLTLDETNQLLNDTLDLSLLTEEISLLYKRTQGWPGVLCLLAGPLGRMNKREDTSQFMATLRLSERQVLDFLAEEILLYLPENLKQFLIQTSILSELTPAICQAVTGRADAAQVLAGLYGRNLAIASLTPESEGEPVYRYHALFAQMLVQQLEREMPDKKRELHHRAAEVQRTPGRAIAHYFAAKLWDQAAQLMVKSGMELLHRGMADTVTQWYRNLPVETRNSHPYLTILMGRCEIHRGEYITAGTLLDQARQSFVTINDEAGEGEALTSLITLSYKSGDRKSVASYVKRASALPLKPMGQVATKLAQVWLDLLASSWEAAASNIREGLVIPSASGDRRADIIGITYLTVPMMGMPDSMRLTEHYCAEVSSVAPSDTAWYLGAQELGAWHLIWRGELDEALTRVARVEFLRQKLGGYPFVGNDWPAQLGFIALAKGNLAEAERGTELLIERLEHVGETKGIFHFHAAGCLLGFLGRITEARVMQERLVALDDDFPLINYLIEHLKGLLALLDGNHGEATVALETAVLLEVQLPMASVGGSARLLQAQLLLNQGQPDRACMLAREVLKEWNMLSTPGFTLMDGPAIQEILELVITDKSCKQLNTVNRELIEPLTSREREVLELLIAGRTNGEISTELHISKETVKSHVSHIFRKLDVSSRTQAVIRARELGL